ncbi:MAG: hypothetical protein ACYYK0_02750 [Candidatus Eutrophobiaceae bacterium]
MASVPSTAANAASDTWLQAGFGVNRTVTDDHTQHLFPGAMHQRQQIVG